MAFGSWSLVLSVHAGVHVPPPLLVLTCCCLCCAQTSPHYHTYYKKAADNGQLVLTKVGCQAPPL